MRKLLLLFLLIGITVQSQGLHVGIVSEANDGGAPPPTIDYSVLSGTKTSNEYDYGTPADMGGTTLVARNFGGKTFILSTTGYTLYEYSEWTTNVSTLTYSGNSFALGSTAQDFWFSDDGLIVAYIGPSPFIRWRTLSVAYDLTSTVSGEFNAALDGIALTDPRGWAWVDNGNTVIIAGNTDDEVAQYSCPTAFTGTTNTLDGNWDIAAQGLSQPKGVGVSPDGKYLLISDSTDGDIYQWLLGTLYDITGTHTFQGQLDCKPPHVSGPQGFSYNNDGTMLIVIDNDATGKKIYEWDLNNVITYDTDYQAILDRATTLVYTKPSTAQQIKQNRLVLDLKTEGLWGSFDAFYSSANDGSDEFGRLNWVSPTTNELTKVGTVTWTSNIGFKAFNGTSYINTNYNPTDDGTNYTTGDASAFIYTATEGTTMTGFKVLTGSVGASGEDKVSIYWNATVLGFYINRNVFTESTESGYAGFVHINRNNATNDIALWWDGVQQSTANLSELGLPNRDIYIGGMNGNGTFGSADNLEWGVAGYGGNLVGKEAVFNIIITNYINGL